MAWSNSTTLSGRRASTPGRAAAQITSMRPMISCWPSFVDDRLAQRAGLGEQLVEQLGGRAGRDELGGDVDASQ